MSLDTFIELMKSYGYQLSCLMLIIMLIVSSIQIKKLKKELSNKLFEENKNKREFPVHVK